MVTEILGFTLFIVLVFAGIVSAFVRYSKDGNVTAHAEYRVNMDKYNLEENEKSPEKEDSDAHDQNMKFPHVMA